MTTRAREASPGGTSSGVSVAKDAILVLIRRLSQLKSSAQGDLLMDRAKAQLAEVDAWELSSTRSERRNELMKRTLQLHFEVVSLERGETTHRQ